MSVAGIKPFLDYAFLADFAENHAQDYRQAEPFPHIVIDNFIDESTVDLMLGAFPEPKKRENHDDESQKLADGTVAQYKKHWISMELRAGLPIRHLYWELNAAGFLDFLQRLTGINALIPDPYRAGGGLHESKAGGFLMVHADYNKQPETDLDRRLNIIIYLNKDWQPDYGGDLELWTPDMKHCVKKVAPLAGRAVIFSTGARTFHGHPSPLACPPDRSRKSISTFYYTNGRPEGEDDSPHVTIWKKTPGQDDT